MSGDVGRLEELIELCVSLDLFEGALEGASHYLEFFSNEAMIELHPFATSIEECWERVCDVAVMLSRGVPPVIPGNAETEQLLLAISDLIRRLLRDSANCLRLDLRRAFSNLTVEECKSRFDAVAKCASAVRGEIVALLKSVREMRGVAGEKRREIVEKLR